MKTKECLFAFIMVFTLSMLAAANDSYVAGVSGSPRFVKGEHKSVQMVSEKVRADVYQDHYTVDAVFVFKNHGGAAMVRMGFPEHAYNTGEREQKVSSFRWFKTWVGGQRVYAKRVRTNIGAHEEDPYVEAIWVKKVYFRKGQTRTVRVRYSAIGKTSVSGDFVASYAFTGGNWKGRVEKTEFEAFLHLKGANLVVASPELKRKGNVFRAEWKNWEAEKTVEISHYVTFSGAMLLDDFPRYNLDLGKYTEDKPENEKPIDKNFFIYETPGTAKGKGVSLLYYSPFIRKKEAVMVRFDLLYEWLNDKGYAEECDGEPVDKKKSRIRRFKSTALGKCITLEEGKNEMLVEGEKNIRLPRAPFGKLHPLYEVKEVYVPLKPVAELLGIGVMIDNKTRRVRLTSREG